MISRFYFIDRLYTTISTLTLVPSLLLDRKRFTCVVYHEALINNTNFLHRSFEVKISSPPDIPIIYGYSPTDRLINGSYITLQCQSYGGYPLGRLSWHRLENKNKLLTLISNSSIVLRQANITESNISMIIEPSDNNVTLSCHVTNDYLDSLERTLQTNITLQVACKLFK